MVVVSESANVDAGLVRETTQASPGIFPMQGHGEPLAEHDGAGAFSLELAGSQGRSLGKLRPNAPGHSAPASADGFHDHRDEGDSLGLTLCVSVLVAALEILISSQGSIRIPNRVSDRVQPKTAGDGEIPGGWGASPPPGNVDVSWATVAGVGVIFTGGGAVFIQRPGERPLG